jgi:hypothetical protein
LCVFSNAAFAQKGTITEKDGKYGIFDINHGVIVPPDCDEITSKSDWGNRFFILKKGEKYAYAYFRNLDSFGKFGYLTPHWEISEFVFDELVQIAPFIVIRFKQNEKYGLIFVMGHFECGTVFNICAIDGLGALFKTEAIYDEPFWYQKDKILHVKSNGKYGFLEFVDKDTRWLNYTYPDWFDTIPIFVQNYRRFVKKDGKWGLIKISPETKAVEYLIPFVSKSYKEIAYTFPVEVFYTKKAINDTVYINDTKTKLQYKLYLPTNEDSKVYVNVLTYYEGINTDANRESSKRYLMIGLCQDHPNAYIFREVTIIDTNGTIKTAYKDSTAEYIIHKNPWGALIEKITNTGKNAILEFFDVETGDKMFTIKTVSNSIISSCELDIPKIPLVLSAPGKKDKMVGYYDFSTKKYYNSPPKKDERCHGF